jgi:hypothetical protein
MLQIDYNELLSFYMHAIGALNCSHTTAVAAALAVAAVTAAVAVAIKVALIHKQWQLNSSWQLIVVHIP